MYRHSANTMRRSVLKAAEGFTMVEVLLAMALGTLVIGAAVALFTSAMQSSWMFTERSEMQQGMRAGLNLMAQDLSIAGTGFPQGGVALPSGAGSTTSRFGCDMSGPIVAGVATSKCYVTDPAIGQRLYAINPGKQVGPTINGNISDAVTLVYSDAQLNLTGCTATVTTRNNTGIVITLSACPTGVTPFDPTQGVLVGDVILLTQTGTSNTAVGVVTAVANPTISFLTGDPLNFNQPGAASGGPNSLPLGSTAVATRLDLISYYLYSPAGVPILERQLGGKSPMPVADNMTLVNFWYDTVNGTTGAYAPPSQDANGTPNQIRRVNPILTAETQYRGSLAGKGVEQAQLSTSVCPRNIAFTNRYQ